MAGTWQRLAHVSLSSAGDTIDTGTFTAKETLNIIVHGIASGNLDMIYLRFNSDSGNNYGFRKSNNGSSYDTNTSISGVLYHTNNSAADTYAVFNVRNVSDKEKLVIGESMDNNTNGAGNAPRRKEFVSKWANTSAQITSVQVVNGGTGDFAAGSYITVLGASGDITTDEKTTLTNVPENTQYRETDTRKIYRSTVEAHLDDDFSSDGWTDVGSASQGMYCGVNAGSNTGDKMYFKFARDNADQGSYYDLGTTMSDEKWLLQFKIKITQLGTGYADLYFIGLRSNATVDMGANDDSIMFVPVGHESKMRVFGNNNEGTQSGDYAEASFAFSANTDYYVELVRLSATSAKFTIRTGSHTGTSVATATATIDSGIQSLRYISIHNRNGDTDTSQTLEIGEIDDMKFYNNTTTATPSKIVWKERGTA